MTGGETVSLHRFENLRCTTKRVTHHPAMVVDLPGGVGTGGRATRHLRGRLLGVHLVEAGLRDPVLLVVESPVLPHTLLRPAQSRI
jgi:hypothetical protein